MASILDANPLSPDPARFRRPSQAMSEAAARQYVRTQLSRKPNSFQKLRHLFSGSANVKAAVPPRPLLEAFQAAPPILLTLADHQLSWSRHDMVSERTSWNLSTPTNLVNDDATLQNASVTRISDDQQIIDQLTTCNDQLIANKFTLCEENDILVYKVQLLTEMLAVARLDLERLGEELRKMKKEKEVERKGRADERYMSEIDISAISTITSDS